MVLNFKNGHNPNTKDQHVCKYKGSNGKIRYTVMTFDHNEKQWIHELGFKFKSKVLGWVRIREE